MAASTETVAWETTIQTALYATEGTYKNVIPGDGTNYLGFPANLDADKKFKI